MVKCECGTILYKQYAELGTVDQKHVNAELDLASCDFRKLPIVLSETQRRNQS